MKNIIKRFLGKLKQKIMSLFQYQKRDTFSGVLKITPFNPATYQESRTAPFPRVYLVPHFILSISYNHDSEYVGVDMSQYETLGVAHYFVTRVEDSETAIADYLSKHPDSDIEVRDTEMTVSMFEDVVLIEDESGVWEWYD